ncbi:hypothetical protein D3C80_1919480 [compost metagenome]
MLGFNVSDGTLHTLCTLPESGNLCRQFLVPLVVDRNLLVGIEQGGQAMDVFIQVHQLRPETRGGLFQGSDFIL